MSDERINIAELEHIVDFDRRPGIALSGHADLEAYGKAREALPVLLEVVKAARDVLQMFDDPNTHPWWGIAGADARARLRHALTGILS